MSASRVVVYSGEPNFPATDQHPDAVRYYVGGYVVDAVGGEPTQQQVEAVVNPPQPDPQAQLLAAISALPAEEQAAYNLLRNLLNKG